MEVVPAAVRLTVAVFNNRLDAVMVAVALLLPMAVVAVPVVLIVVAPSTVKPPLRATVSKLSPIVMESASALLPTVIVSQLAELQMETLVAVELPIARAPAEMVSTLGVSVEVAA
jgi:hypothetical protein